MGDKQAMDAGNENAVVRAVVGSSPNARGRRRGPQRVVPTAEDEIVAVLQSPGVAEESQATAIGESNQHRHRRKTLS
ncbi:hypothetical protein SprV_0100488700 [Sparganum proliferum]